MVCSPGSFLANRTPRQFQFTTCSAQIHPVLDMVRKMYCPKFSNSNLAFVRPTASCNSPSDLKTWLCPERPQMWRPIPAMFRMNEENKKEWPSFQCKTHSRFLKEYPHSAVKFDPICLSVVLLWGLFRQIHFSQRTTNICEFETCRILPTKCSLSSPLVSPLTKQQEHVITKRRPPKLTLQSSHAKDVNVTLQWRGQMKIRLLLQVNISSWTKIKSKKRCQSN